MLGDEVEKTDLEEVRGLSGHLKTIHVTVLPFLLPPEHQNVCFPIPGFIRDHHIAVGGETNAFRLAESFLIQFKTVFDRAVIHDQQDPVVYRDNI